MFLGKYKSLQRLGKGAYGDVHLVKDTENQGSEPFALKIISKRMVEEDPTLMEYIEGEKESMKKLKSEYTVELYDFDED